MNSNSSISPHEIFFQHSREKYKEIVGKKFAYYTTAETAFKIIKHQELWMRSVLTMNDFSEFEHGRENLIDVMNSDLGQSFLKTLDDKFGSVATESFNKFKAYAPGIKYDTYLTCFSEHSENEDELGRLSMWRAYGGQSGVALIFNTDSFLNLFESHNVTTSPVAYFDNKQITLELEKIHHSVLKHCDYLATVDRDVIDANLFDMFKFASLCNKHPSFQEEKEWRLIHSPYIYPSNNVKTNVELVNGVPQLVAKLKLENNGIDLSLPSILNRIIIGPCEYPNNIAQALHTLIQEKNLTNNKVNIIITNIPLRHTTK